MVTHRKLHHMPKLKIRQNTINSPPYIGAGRSQCIYWDERLPCFGLRVYASGRRTFVCSHRIHKRKRLASLGRADVLTLDQARKKAIRYLGKVADSIDPQIQWMPPCPGATVKTVVDSYVERHAKRKKKTWRDGESCLRRRSVQEHGAKPMTTITSTVIEHIHASIGNPMPPTISFAWLARCSTGVDLSAWYPETCRIPRLA